MSKPRPPTLEDRIRTSLDLYRERGEFDGTIASAKECLELAEYEWTPAFAGSVRRVLGMPKQPIYPPGAAEDAARAAERGDCARLTRLAVLHVADTELTDRPAVEAWLARNP